MILTGTEAGAGTRKRRPARALLPLLALLLGVACSGPPALQPPRNVVLMSGVRLTPTPERLDSVHEWVVAVVESISCRSVRTTGGTPRLIGWDAPSDVGRVRVTTSYCLYPGSESVSPVAAPAGRGGTTVLRRLQDPRIHIQVVPGPRDTYPWETLVVQGDTARVQVARAYRDARTAYAVYAHLHLVHRQGRLESWLPEAAGAEGYPVERAIVKRMADAWLMGRSAFLLDPYRPMDELLYASEAGYLDAFLFTARPDDFPEARQAWLKENPQGLEQYQAWFRSVLGEAPPGVRAETGNPPR